MQKFIWIRLKTNNKQVEQLILIALLKAAQKFSNLDPFINFSKEKSVPASEIFKKRGHLILRNNIIQTGCRRENNITAQLRGCFRDLARQRF